LIAQQKATRFLIAHGQHVRYVTRIGLLAFAQKCINLTFATRLAVSIKTINSEK
jgi:hypothetical protein